MFILAKRNEIKSVNEMIVMQRGARIYASTLLPGFPIQKLQSRVLHLHVFDYDRFSRDDSIGEMFLPLCQVI